MNYISLIADERTLCDRLAADIVKGIRDTDVIEKSVARISMYNTLNTIKIDTSNKSVQMIADEIKEL